MPNEPSTSEPHAAPPRALLAAVVLVALAALLANQSGRQLGFPDELREAGITTEMALSRDLVVPRLNGTPFLEKPPLFHALGAALLLAAGERSELVVRLPAILLGALTLLATALLARRLAGGRAAALAAGLLATLVGFESAVHSSVTDNAVPPFLCLAFLALERARAPGPRLLEGAGAGLALGAAFLGKGLVGPAIFVAGAGIALLVRGEARRLASPAALAAMAGAIFPIAGWLAALRATAGAEAVRVVLVENNWKRATSAAADHAGPPWFYLERAPQALAPWIPLVLLAVWAAVRERRSARRSREGGAPGAARPPPDAGAAGALRLWLEAIDARAAVLPAAWLLGGYLVLSAASAKRSIYQLPLMPAAAILAALALEPLLFRREVLERARRPLAWLAGALVLAPLAVAAAGAALAPGGGRGLALGAAATLALAALLRAALRAQEPGSLLAAVLLGGTVAATALGMSALGRAADRDRGFEEIASILRADDAAGRAIVLFTRSEALRGGAVFSLGRTLPETRTASAVAERRAASPARPLTVVADGTHAPLDDALGPPEVALETERQRQPVWVLRYPALATGTAGAR